MSLFKRLQKNDIDEISKIVTEQILTKLKTSKRKRKLDKLKYEKA